MQPTQQFQFVLCMRQSPQGHSSLVDARSTIVALIYFYYTMKSLSTAHSVGVVMWYGQVD